MRAAPLLENRLAAGPAELPTLDHEHLLLVRRLAQLQRQVSALVLTHQVQWRHWQTQLMRQSVRLMLARTQVAWGLVPGAEAAVSGDMSTSDTSDTAALAPYADQADALICRTGCQMDDDHWREGDYCRRTGQGCHRL